MRTIARHGGTCQDGVTDCSMISLGSGRGSRALRPRVKVGVEPAKMNAVQGLSRRARMRDEKAPHNGGALGVGVWEGLFRFPFPTRNVKPELPVEICL